jgi:CheY-like chemotaxis protein
VLVVDDEPAIRTMLATPLREAGYDVRLAADGAGGLAQIGTWRPDVIFLDLVLPRATGWAFVPEYRGRCGHRAAILVMTAAGPGAVRSAQALDVEEVLVKPLNLDHALELVASDIQQRRSWRQPAAAS